jgi:hypothetical protein
MDKKIAGLIGAVVTLASVDMAQAATPAAPHSDAVLQAQSYAELLAPIPNALTLLQAADAAGLPQITAGEVMEARYYRHHHHHHHHRHYRRHHHHHHHHYRR